MKVVRAALVVDRCRRHVGFDQLDPSTLDDLVVGRGHDCDSPTEMVCNPEVHAPICSP